MDPQGLDPFSRRCSIAAVTEVAGAFLGQEVGTVRRQVHQLRAGLFNCFPHAGHFVCRKVVQHHDVAGSQRRRELLPSRITAPQILQYGWPLSSRQRVARRQPARQSACSEKAKHLATGWEWEISPPFADPGRLKLLGIGENERP